MSNIKTQTFEQYTSTQEPLKVEQGYIISLEYIFNDKDGTVLGSSEHSGEYTFLPGLGDAIPGLEKKLEGAIIGETRTFSIPAKEAYGETDKNLIHTLHRSSFPKDYRIDIGSTATINNTPMTITAVEDDFVTVDGNHPLAGKELFFTTTIKSITPISEEEEHSCSCGGSCGCGS